jgi:hypothetical protein
MIHLSPKAAIHRLNNVFRISEHVDLARLFYALEPHRSSRDLGLLVRRLA